MRVGDVLLSSAILLSGNNFEKVKLMFSFLGLRIMSRSSHFKIQQKHCCPIIEREFAQMTEKNIEKYIGKEVVVLGECCSKKCNFVYYFMVEISRFILINKLYQLECCKFLTLDKYNHLAYILEMHSATKWSKNTKHIEYFRLMIFW